MTADDPARMLTRQVRELAVRRARLRRRRAEAAGNPAQLSRVDAAISRLVDEIDHRRDHRAIVASTGSYHPWSHHHFRVGTSPAPAAPGTRCCTPAGPR